MRQKIIIYQLLPRLFSNTCQNPVFNGSLEQNGCGKFNDLTEQVLNKLRDLGITHIWLTGIIRHATLSDYRTFGLPPSHPDIVKGIAGSPYAINDYFDLDPDLAMDIPHRMEEFEQLIQRIHLQKLKVIIDFVPNHVARDYHSFKHPPGYKDLGETDNSGVSFSPSNNYYYFPGLAFQIRDLPSKGIQAYREFPAKATGNDVFRCDPDFHDWYDTVKLNYGVDYQTKKGYFNPLPDTWVKMTGILWFWSNKGVDGFRCDMAGMVPVGFWQYAIGQIKSEYREMLFIAELYEPSKYREYLESGFFDFLYDKVGMYDALREIVIRKSSTRAITSVWQSLEGLDNAMVRFLENHDEQRIASTFFAEDPWKGIPGLAVAAFMNNGPVLLYSGQEVGEPAVGSSGFSGDDGRTSIFDYAVLPELQKWYNHGRCDGMGLSEFQRQLRIQYSKILRLAKEIPVFCNGLFYDLMWANEDNPYRDRIFAFLRYGSKIEEDAVMVVISFDPSVNETLIRIPLHALEVIGYGSKQRIKITGIEPDSMVSEPYLFSQVISIGIQINMNLAGYAVLSIQ